jgi:integrase
MHGVLVSAAVGSQEQRQGDLYVSRKPAVLPTATKPLSESVYDRWWKLARERVLTPAQVGSPLARRPYDLRHAAASLWLNAGVPATEVARRLGHSVAVLLKVYANCIDGAETA